MSDQSRPDILLTLLYHLLLSVLLQFVLSSKMLGGGQTDLLRLDVLPSYQSYLLTELLILKQDSIGR